MAVAVAAAAALAAAFAAFFPFLPPLGTVAHPSPSRGGGGPLGFGLDILFVWFVLFIYFIASDQNGWVRNSDVKK